MRRICLWGADADPDFVNDVQRALREVDVDAEPTSPTQSSTECGILLVGEHEPTATQALQSRNPDGSCRIMVIGKSASLSQPGRTWRLRSHGAAEVLAWETAGAPAVVAARLQRWSMVDQLLAAVAGDGLVVGRSPAWLAMLRQVIEIAAFTTASVVLIGESGTGKELLARLIHELDRRRDKGKLVTLDCTTVVPELSGSEFFGHERGAFTGAFATRDGAFAHANGGTLFLDEVGELPLGIQAQLLRVIEEGTYKRVGGNDWFHARFRLVCATNRRLLEEVDQRRFRLDFYHRIGSWILHVPSLRERVEDIIPLARHFMTLNLGPGANTNMDECVDGFLSQRDYPGNVRELRQLVGRMCGGHVGTGPFTAGDIPVGDLGATTAGADRGIEEAAGLAALQGFGLKEIGRIARNGAIQKALRARDGNVQLASKLLRVTDRALQLELAKRDE
jgi:transcriptional regulator with GAF, ATPase, and Fis domain